MSVYVGGPEICGSCSDPVKLRSFVGLPLP